MPDHLAVGGRLNLYCVLEGAVEQQATLVSPATVESKSVFVKIVRKMLVAHGPLMGSAEPSLQEQTS